MDQDGGYQDSIHGELGVLINTEMKYYTKQYVEYRNVSIPMQEINRKGYHQDRFHTWRGFYGDLD